MSRKDKKYRQIVKNTEYQEISNESYLVFISFNVEKVIIQRSVMLHSVVNRQMKME
jgi:hypothetical protein